MFARELAAHFHADFIDVAVRDGAVRAARNKRIQKCRTRARCCSGKAWMLVSPFSLMMTISPGSTSRTNLAWIKSNAQVSLASTYAPFAVRPMDKRAEPVRIAHADQFLLRHDDQRIRAFDAAHRLHQRSWPCRPSSAGRASCRMISLSTVVWKIEAAAFKFVAQLRRRWSDCRCARWRSGRARNPR